MKAMTTMFCGMTKLFILTVLAITFIASSVAAFADPPILEGKEIVSLNVCFMDNKGQMVHGGADRLCLVYKDPKQAGKTWFAVYEGELMTSVHEGDDTTFKVRQVWHLNQLDI